MSLIFKRKVILHDLLSFCPGNTGRSGFSDFIQRSYSFCHTPLKADWILLESFFPREFRKCQNGHINHLDLPGNEHLIWSWEWKKDVSLKSFRPPPGLFLLKTFHCAVSLSKQEHTQLHSIIRAIIQDSLCSK